jgi:hypothetical protein
MSFKRVLIGEFGGLAKFGGSNDTALLAAAGSAWAKTARALLIKAKTLGNAAPVSKVRLLLIRILQIG